MTSSTIKASSSLEFLNARLDEIRMSAHERLRAKASLAHAEAIADVLVNVSNATKRVLLALIRPIRRLTTALG